MSLFESPSGSISEDQPTQPTEPGTQQNAPPRRAETLPVRFDETRAQESFTSRRPRPRPYGEQPSRRPSYVRAPESERRRSPPSRYQSYYESEEDEYEYIGRKDVNRPRDDAFLSLDRGRYDTYGDSGLYPPANRFPGGATRSARFGNDRPSPPPPPARIRVIERESRSPSPPPSPARVRVIERERRRSPSIRRAIIDERERDRSYSPVQIRRRARSPSPYRYDGGRSRARSQAPSPMTFRREREMRTRGSRFDRDDGSEDLRQAPLILDEDDLDSHTYSFTLSRHSKSFTGSDNSAGSVSDVSEKGESHESEAVTTASSQGKIRHIYKSQYVGDGLLGGAHAVKLIEAAEETQVRKKMPPIFQWMHFEDTGMDFDQFQSNVTAISSLSDNERSAITKLLKRAKKRYDKPIQSSKGAKSRYMIPSYLQENINTDARPKASPRIRTVSWICVPYFVLDNYSTDKPPRPSSHPMRTLLQARFSLVQKERDMQQAVRLLPNAPALETCFHIAQVWFVVLDDSLLVSCARLSMSSLQGDIISISPNPQTGSTTAPSTSILVTGKNSLLWSLPASECQDWFAFISHFWEYWPRSLEFSYHEKVITADDWPRILVLANKSNIRLVLEFKNTFKEPTRGILLENPIAEEFESPPTHAQNPPSHGVSGPSSKLKVGKSPKAPVTSSDVTFRVFTWLNRSVRSSMGGITIVSPDNQLSEVYQDLTEIDDFLEHKTNLNEKLTYRECPLRSRDDIYRLIARERRTVTEEDMIDTQWIKRKRFETKVDILNAAELLFQFFLPPTSKGPTVDKFWGAIYKVLETPTEFFASQMTPRQFLFARDAMDVLDWLKTITRVTVPFRDLFSQVQDHANNIQIPEELPKAYLHLLMSLAFITNDMQLFDEQMTLCSELIELGTRKLVQNMSLNHLSEYATFVPLELASVIVFQLVQDITGPAIDICETYWEYIKVLQANIENNPLDRNHQDRIVFLNQEISVISETLEQQQKLLSLSLPYLRSHSREIEVDIRGPSRSRQRRAQSTFYDRNYDQNSPLITNLAPAQRSQGSGLDPGGVQGLVAQDAMIIIDSRIKDFREMREQASDLGSWNIQRIDSNKDRQEAAVYAFTVVTIIFLPLSTVAGILGMNTYDVRNMNVNQWVFWATALPLTVLVVTLCLIWAGELNNFWTSFSKLWRKNPTYTAIPERYSSRERGKFDDDEDVIVRRASGIMQRYPAPRVRRSHTLYGGRENYV